MLTKRNALREAGLWAVRTDVFEAVTPETLAWMKEAEANFSKCLFIKGEHSQKIVSLDDAQTARAAVRYAVGIDEDINFRGFIFPGDVYFDGAVFNANAWFQDATFEGEAVFEGATFKGHGLMNHAVFKWYVLFDDVSFEAIAEFETAMFSGITYFNRVTFKRQANFDRSTFAKEASFEDAAFEGEAFFQEVTFRGEASFNKASFLRSALYERANFKSIALFVCTAFKDVVSFQRARFAETARFDQSHFSAGADWTDASARILSFKAARFDEGIELDVSEVKRLDFAGSIFSIPPELNEQAASAASFDNTQMTSPSLLRLWWSQVWLGREPDPLLATRFRRYKAAAIKDCDNFSEHEFFVGELVGRVLCRHRKLSPVTLVALAYEATSNFGRSILLPLFWWTLVTVLFSAFYLSQTEVVQREMALQDSWAISAAAQAGGYALSNSVPCYPPPLTPAENWRKRWRWRGTPLPDPNATRVDGLSEKLRNRTNARAEALHLAFRNAFVVLDGGSDASHRMYGCLYGL